MSRSGPPLLVAIAIGVLVAAFRALDFGDGITLAATPASALALGAAVVLRARGVAAAVAGFVLGGLLAGLGPGDVLTGAAAQGLAAFLGALVMRTLARRNRSRSRTSEWFIFAAGVGVFTASVSAIVLAGSAAGLVTAPDTWTAARHAAAFEPLGLLTLGAVLANLREYPAVRADLRPAAVTAAIAAALLGILGLLLSLPQEMVSPSGTTLLLSVPFCLWVAMQHRSLDGALVSFLAAHVALYMILRDAGSVDTVQYVTTALYLTLLVMTCQLVHSVNRDRLAALAEVAAHKAELEARVAERTQRLALMTERALAADAAKTRFLATVSHEVRTPLNGVIGMASVLLAGDLDETERRNATMIRNSGLHLLDVINRILDYFRLGQAPEAHDDIDFDLVELAEEVLDEARFSPHAEDLDLRAEVAPGLATMRHGYRQGLRQILTNLVGNAAKFTEEGSVTVRLLPGADGAVRIEVEDTGIGIPEDRRQQIFEPYEQVDGSISRRYGGTGLGLAICAELADRLGGGIGVDSAETRGSLFWLELPLALATTPEARPAEPLTS